VARIVFCALSNVTWLQEPYVDSFVEGFVAALKRAGNDILNIRINDLSLNGKLIADAGKLSAKIKSFAPTLIITMNNVFPYDGIIEDTDCPIACFAADSYAFFSNKHLIEKYAERYYFYNFSNDTIKTLQDWFPCAYPNRNVLFGHTTDLRTADIPQDINLSFIGSMANWNRDFVRYFQSLPHYDLSFDEQNAAKDEFFDALDKFKKNPLGQFDCEFVGAPHWNLSAAASAIHLLTCKARFDVLSGLTDLGLRLFGYPFVYCEALIYNPDLFRCFDYTPSVSMAHATRNYNRSKVSLNLPHAHAKEGFSWRVCDILASNATLLSCKQPDLVNITKGYVDLPTFESPAEAREIAIKLLKDPERRKDLTLGSQKMIEDKCRFEQKFRIMEQSLSNLRLFERKEGSVEWMNGTEYCDKIKRLQIRILRKSRNVTYEVLDGKMTPAYVFRRGLLGILRKILPARIRRFLSTLRHSSISRVEVLQIMEENKRHFLEILNALKEKTSPEERVQICAQASLFAVNNPCSILYSHEIEGELKRIADTIKTRPVEGFIPGSILHVMTRAYVSGGHTRVCERWIQASPDGQKHDVALINQGTREVPKLLEKVAREKAGGIIRVDGVFPLEKAAALRELASRYEYVVLHTHMYDVVPMMAFGGTDFQRPVIFYNHADHSFWLGASIADLVVNYRSFTAKLDTEGRNVKEHAFLPLPLLDAELVAKPSVEDSVKLKAELGFPKDSKVILTIASSYKYKPIGEIDFVKTVKQILALSEHAVVLAIGPSKKEKYWRKAYQESGGRINPIGVVPASELSPYLRIADFALGSFPFGSAMALLETVKYNVPCGALRTPTNTLDAFEEADIFCKNVPELIKHISSLLRNPPSSNKLYEIVKRDCLPGGFSKKLAELYAAFPSKHEIRAPEPRRDRAVSDFEIFVAQNMLAERYAFKNILKKFVRRILYLYAIHSYPLGMSKRLYTALNSYGLL
jgi:hypothetical protein